jgi:hypothetical protein
MRLNVSYTYLTTQQQQQSTEEKYLFRPLIHKIAFLKVDKQEVKNIEYKEQHFIVTDKNVNTTKTIVA